MLHLLRQHHYLFWQFTKRTIAQRHRGSALGMLWMVLQPLLMMSVYVVMFGVVFNARYRGASHQGPLDYALGVFLSITIFQVVTDAITGAPAAITSQPNLVKKVVFPLEILPLAGAASSLFQFFSSMLLVLAGIAFFGDGLMLHSLWIVVVLLPLVPLILGLGLVLSSLGVFLRDMQHVAGPAALVVMYASGVFYSPEMVPHSIWRFLRFNPLVHIIDQARQVLLWHQPVHWTGLLYSLMFGLLLTLLGTWLFKKLKPAFADVL